MEVTASAISNPKSKIENRKCSGLRVPGVGNLDALGQKPLAATLPAAGKDGATVFRLHARAEAKLPLAGALRGLIGAFHSASGKIG